MNKQNYVPKIGDLVSDGSYPFHPRPILSVCKHYYKVAGGGITKSRVTEVWKKRKNTFIKMKEDEMK